jgi:hypothetical protein
MPRLWQRISGASRRRGNRLDTNAIEKSRVAREVAERERHRETGLQPGRSNTDWTYISPPN